MTEPIMEFGDQSIVITGAGMGIGRMTAHNFARRGGLVTVSDIDLSRAETVTKEIVKEGGKAIAVKADVTEYDDATALIDKAIAGFGKVDILVNNAGTSHDLALFIDTKPRDWEIPLRICLYGVLNCCHAVLPSMVERKQGRIINVVSIAGLEGHTRLAVYSGAKAGIIGFSKALAAEVGRHAIHVNCVSFGQTESENIVNLLTEMPEYKERAIKKIPLRRFATMQDQANAIMLLASPYATFITGQTLNSDGGRCMH